MDLEQRIKEVSKQLADLRNRLPAHSLKPWMWAQVEQLEDELERLQQLSDGKEGEPCRSCEQ